MSKEIVGGVHYEWLLRLVIIVFIRQNEDYIMSNTKTTVTYTTSIGATLAVVLSYSINKSILWAILHGIFSWFYVIYFAIAY
jgi:hypothetical protein